MKLKDLSTTTRKNAKWWALPWAIIQWVCYPFIALWHTSCPYCVFIRGVCLGAFLMGVTWWLVTKYG